MYPLHYMHPFPSLVHSYSPVSHPQEDTYNRSSSEFVNRFSHWFSVSIAVVVKKYTWPIQQNLLSLPILLRFLAFCWLLQLSCLLFIYLFDQLLGTILKSRIVTMIL